ncbi:hypothetical protein EDB86DRAFT_3070329 [Lactarius hatsudake]|nr:hypothetical protein EDB86DRAFT_3070329 [Lactarius hatsudake]
MPQQLSVDQPEVPATQGSRFPCPSKTRAMENTPWHRLKPKTYLRVSNSAATDACTMKVNVPPPKKKRQSNTDTFSTATDLELPVEDPNDEETNETFDNEAVGWDNNQSPKPSQYRQLARRNGGASGHGSVGWDNDQPLEPSQYRQPPYHSYEDNEASDYGDFNVDDFDINNGLRVTNYGDVNDTHDDIDNDINGIDVNYHDDDDDDDDNLGGPWAHAKGPLSKCAAERRAELVILSDNNYHTLPASTASLSVECNACWPHAPICPPGPKQRNILINMQPEDFRAILKEGMQALLRHCAFRQGYILVDTQTDHFIELLIKSATRLNKPHYVLWLQKDAFLQKEVCDLLSGRVSHYHTTIKQVATSLVSHGYRLEDDELTWVRQVKDLINNDKFIFKPKDDGGINPTRPFQHPVIINTLCGAFFKRKQGSSFAQRNHCYFPLGINSVDLQLPPAMVYASLEEKAYGSEFNANAYEDSYNIHVATLREIQDNNGPAYRHLMSDLYKLVMDDPKTRVCDSTNNAMVLLDLNGMAV